MSLFKLRSLRLQTIFILLAGLAVSHLAGLFIYTMDRRDAVAATEALDIAERATGIVILLRNLPEGWREDVLRASDSRLFRVWRTSEAILRVPAASDEDERVLDHLRALLPRLADREMRVSVTASSPPGAEPPPRVEPPGAPTDSAFDTAAEVVTISIHHPDGYWLNVVGAVPRPASAWPGLFSAYILTLVFGAGVLGFWLVRRVTQPLEDFTQAANRLGKNLRASPLGIEGPTEVAVAARAFNRMQQRIARLVENRVELLAAISHDLRTPITRLKLRAETLGDGEDRERFLTALEEMEAVTATFLDYARSSFGNEERSRTELTSLVESVCSDYSDTGANVAWEDGAPIYLDCKRTAVRRAVSNLVDNAVKYGGGASVRVRRNEGHVDIIVDDRGPGIPADALEAVLMPFHRGEPSRSKNTGGVGLGLSIAQAVAHDHGGDLTLENLDAGGLRAALRVPE